jgi:hypothetical protein
VRAVSLSHIVSVDVPHSPRVLEILREIGFAEDDDRSIKVTDPRLQLTRHIPRSAKAEGKFSPSNMDLFYKYPSAQNLQFATSEYVSSYLTTYVTEIDKVAMVHMKPPNAAAPKTVKGDLESLHNTKIASVKIFNEKKCRQTKHQVPMGRPITQMEALTVLQGQNLVTSTRMFLGLPTCPREYRAACPTTYLRVAKLRPDDLQAMLAVTGQTAREQKHFPSGRLFTASQLTVIRDELDTPFKTDLVIYFSMRPPEL